MFRFKSSEATRIFTLVLLVLGCLACYAADKADAGSDLNSGLYLKVKLDGAVKFSKLKPGDVVRGKLARAVYSAGRELFPAESAVQLRVEHTESRRRTGNDHWPWVVKVFTPRHEQYPVFQSATVAGGKQEQVLPVSVLSISRRREVHAQAKGKQREKSGNEAGTVETSQTGGVYGGKHSSTAVMVLEATYGKDDASRTGGKDSAGSFEAEISAVEALPAGTGFKILLLGDVSASRSKPGDVLEARLLQPVFFNSRLALPAGSLFTGKILKATPPRWGSRAGSLSLAFTAVTFSGGNTIPMTASLMGAELDRGSQTTIDAEGKLHGERPGKVWMAINLGVTAGLAKEVDDGAQLIVEALISTATDASTAGTARIVSSCVSGIYMVTRHGRDVVLPRFTEMDIALDRPLAVTKNVESASAGAVVRGN